MSVRIGPEPLHTQRDLEQDKTTLPETYSERASWGLDYFNPEDRHQAYKKLRLSVVVHPGGDLEVSGVLGEASRLVKKNGTSRNIGRRRPEVGRGFRRLAILP